MGPRCRRERKTTTRHIRRTIQGTKVLTMRRQLVASALLCTAGGPRNVPCEMRHGDHGVASLCRADMGRRQLQVTVNLKLHERHFRTSSYPSYRLVIALAKPAAPPSDESSLFSLLVPLTLSASQTTSLRNPSPRSRSAQRPPMGSETGAYPIPGRAWKRQVCIGISRAAGFQPTWRAALGPHFRVA